MSQCKIAEETTQMVCVVGCGTMAARQVETGTPWGLGCRSVAIDWSAGDHMSRGNCLRIELGERPLFLCGGDSIPADTAFAATAVAQRIGLVLDAIGKAPAVALVAGIGGGTAAGIVLEVAAKLSALRIAVTAVVAMPFLFEGQRRSRAAERALDQLATAGVETMVVDGRAFDIRSDCVPSYADAFQWMGERLMEAACRTVCDLTARSFSNYTIQPHILRCRSSRPSILAFGATEEVSTNLAPDEDIKPPTIHPRGFARI